MRTWICVASLVLFACPPPTKYPPPPTGRCDVDLEQYKFANVGTGVAVTQTNLTTLQNDRLTVDISPDDAGVTGKKVPFGATLTANFFGSLVLNYASGRTMKGSTTEVLQDGAAGGYAVVAVTGRDGLNDTFNLHREADTELPLLLTTYFVLSPGESRVRVLTAFCNEGKETITTSVGDLIDFGGGEVFNAGGCANGFGTRACGADSSKWIGSDFGQLAWGYRAYSLNDSVAPAMTHLEPVGNAFMTSLDGFGILPGDKRVFVRDVFFGHDLSEISSTMLALDAAGRSRVTLTATLPLGTLVPKARINVKRAEDGEAVTIATTDQLGVARFDLSPGNYLVSTGAEGYAIEPATALTVPSNGTAQATLKYGESRLVSITNVGDVGGRVIVRCANPPCATRSVDYRAFSDIGDRPDDVQGVFFSGPGTVFARVPPGEYAIELTNGPLVSRAMTSVDARTGDQSVAADLWQRVAPVAGAFERDVVTPWDLGMFSGGSLGGSSSWDWTGGDGPTLRLDELFALMHPLGPIALETPRTTLAALQVDTATGQSHADAGYFRMEPAANLFSFDFDAMAVNSVAEFNDWLTFIANGHPKRAEQYGQPRVMLTTSFDGGVFSAGDALDVPAGTQLELTVDVQAADWVQFDVVEVHTDAPGRESLGGVANNTLVPAALTQTLNPTTLPTDGGVVHVTQTFTITVDQSTWFVALVRGSGASAPIDTLTGAKVFAVTDALTVTAH